MMPLWSSPPERPPISFSFLVRLLSRWHKARKHSELCAVQRERETGERSTRERERGPFVSGGEGTATSKFGNCFLDWLGRSGSLISVCFSATCLKLLKFYYYYYYYWESEPVETEKSVLWFRFVPLQRKRWKN